MRTGRRERVHLRRDHSSSAPGEHIALQRVSSSPQFSVFDLHRNLGNRLFKQMVDGALERKCSCGGTCSHCEEERRRKDAEMKRSLGVNSHRAMNFPHDEGEPAKSQKKIAGLDIDKSFCSCAKEIPDKIKWSQLQAKIYLACSKDPKNKAGKDVDDCDDAELAKMGITTTVAGTTSSTGAVVVKPVAGTCGPIWQKATELHEAEHHGHQGALEKAFGKGTKAFAAHWNDPKDWGEDEARAYTAEIPFYQAVLAYLQSICGGGGGIFSGWGALFGGLGGAGVGALIGSLFGPVGALVGLGVGAVAGLITGGFIGGAS